MTSASLTQLAVESDHWRQGWRLRDEHNEFDLKVSLPCDAISALFDESLIPDPYFGRNEYDLRWIANRDWVLEKSFEVNSNNYDLVLSELDTVAKVYINDQCVLECENQFRLYRVDISRAIRQGQNALKIVLSNNIKAAAEKQNKQPWYVPWHKENCPIPNGNMLRKVQCDFGWDWNIALAPLGLYGDCYLQSRDIQRIDQIKVSQTFSEDMQHLAVHIHATIVSLSPSSFNLSASLCGQTINTVVDESNTRFTSDGYLSQQSIYFSIDNPELWWPNGLGAATLHELIVKTHHDEQHRNIGFRTIELITESDSSSSKKNDSHAVGESSSFYFKVNGIALFAKGANWIPADALPARITNEKTLGLLQSAADANMNMIRVWGGGRYESDYFYNCCDELGLLVWQDFMFACNLYPHTGDFLEEVRCEVQGAVRRLQHHPSIALWCGDNELVGALTWFKESIDNRDRYLVAYDRLNHTIERALYKEAPDANWWPSSPSSGRLNFGDAWHDDQSGDMHFWSVWHEGKDFEHYRDIRPRFCSEFGFQSYPSMPVIRSFTDDSDLNIASPVMESHQKNTGGNARIAETMFRYFRFPDGFENFVYLSQIQQGVAIKTAVDYWRSEKPHCMGSLYWQLNDTWPVASWSSLNYGGSWKHLHHMARRFFNPTTVVCIPDATGWKIIATSDLQHSSNIIFNMGAVSLKGQIRLLDQGVSSLDHRRNVLLSYISKDAIKEDEWLFWNWTEERQSSQCVRSNKEQVSEHVEPAATEILESLGNNFSTELLAPKPYKTYELPEAGVKLSVSKTDFGWSLILQSLRPAVFVTVESDLEGQLSDNAFSLLPGISKQIDFTVEESLQINSPNFVIRDLQTATQ